MSFDKTIERELDRAATRSNIRLFMREAALNVLAAFVEGLTRTLRIVAKIIGYIFPFILLALFLEILVK